MTDTPTETPPKNVIEALARVMAELPGIGKDDKSDQGYKYRGIESITAHAQHLLGKYGVVFVPKVISRTVKDFTINSRPWTEDAAEVVYTVYGPGGVEDRIEVGPLIGLGRDNSDKGMNKSMTQAYKYALIQTLCIGDGKDDPDADKAHEADARQPAPPPLTHEQEGRNHLHERIRALTPEQREKVRTYCDEHKIPRVVARMDLDQLAAVGVVVDQVCIAAAQDEAPEAPQTPVEPPQTAETGNPPTPAPAEPPATPPDAVDGLQAAIDTVAGMKIADIFNELEKRNLSTSGNAAARAQRLAQALVDGPIPAA